MGNLNREQELWNLIKYSKEAISEQLREWCRELMELKEAEQAEEKWIPDFPSGFQDWRT